MTQSIWMKIDREQLENPPALLTPEDECYFLREYTAGGGYAASVGNQLIENFKKKRETEGTAQWTWKKRAARQFARELADLLGDEQATLVAIPPSKVRDDDAFDPRFDLLAENLREFCPNITIEEPLVRKESVKALHEGGERNLRSIYKSLRWAGFEEEPPERIYLVDDVLTRGTSYRACKLLLQKHHPGLEVIGLFWTRCIWKNDAAAIFADDIDPEEDDSS